MKGDTYGWEPIACLSIWTCPKCLQSSDANEWEECNKVWECDSRRCPPYGLCTAKWSIAMWEEQELTPDGRLVDASS